MSNILIAFLLTTAAGLATGIGSALSFFAKTTNTKFLSISLGFSAGVMIYVSMIELLGSSFSSLALELGEKTGNLVAIIAFFGGMGVIALIDKLVPNDENPHHVTDPNEVKNLVVNNPKLARTGLMTALAIGIHNFPEGLASFVAALQSAKIALPIVIAIALHNIPEGIAVSVPIYYATNDKKKAFWYSFLSGLSEPIGALVGYLILRPFINETVNGILFAVVAGIMVFISFDELLPAAKEYGEHHLSIYGLIAGMLIMALSLWLFI